jgi:hypothetical protein
LSEGPDLAGRCKSLRMKPRLLKVPKTPAHSFSVREDKDPYINNRWHYHPEVELIYFHEGGGTQFVGDHIKRFDSGDIILVAPIFLTTGVTTTYTLTKIVYAKFIPR